MDILAFIAAVAAMTLWLLTILATIREPQQDGAAPQSDESLHRKNERRYWRFSLLISWAALLGALGAAGAAYLAYTQTRRQADLADDAERRGMRAYAYPVISPVADFEVGKKVHAGITVHSLGQTPAYNVHASATFGFFPYPLSDDKALDGVADPSQVQNSSFISPPSIFKVEMETSGPLSQEQFDAVQKGTAYRLYLWGRVDYEDVFRAKHWFLFCYSYDGLAIQQQESVPCPRNNDDDHSAETHHSGDAISVTHEAATSGMNRYSRP